jgi:transmembrane sensor
LSDEAVEWLVRVKFGQATPAAHADWRRRSPAHDAAAREAEALWQDVGETRVAAAAARHRPLPQRAHPSRRLVVGGGIAASLAIGVVASGVIGPPAGLLSDHTTRIGERRRIVLPDQSIALLNTASALSVRYTAGARDLRLDAGEALFQVEKDAARPFIVHAGPGAARALGTTFAVRRADDEIRVVVSEGQVLVLAPGADAVRLAAGEGAAFGADGLHGAPGPLDAAAATAWHRGKLIFNQRPLGEVVAELDRYHRGRILLADAELAGLPVTGVFGLDDRDGVLHSIERVLPVSVSRWPLLTILRAKNL